MMAAKLKIWLALSVALVLSPRVSWAQEPAHAPRSDRAVFENQSALQDPDALALLSALELSLSHPIKTVAERSGLKIEEVERAFLNLPRVVPASEIRELKYAMMHWRKKTLEKLLGLVSTVSDAELVELLQAVNALSVELDPTSYQTLKQRFDNSKDFKPAAWAELKYQLPILNPLVEPQVSEPPSYRIVPTRPVEKSEAGNPSAGVEDHSEISKWAPQTQRALDHGNWISPAPDQGEGAYRFRGRIVVKPGDLFLIEQNNQYSSDLNTCVADPISLFSHVGIFLEIENDGKRLPAVLEIYSHGLRIVPAELYLGRRFSHYTEIHRFKEASAEWPALLRKLGEKYRGELKDWRYDFYAKEFQRSDAKRERTANCANLPSQVLIELGCDPISTRCQVAEGARPLLKRLGLKFDEYLTPTDYRRDPRLDLVGVVDSLDLESNLSLELVIRNHNLAHTAAGYLTHRQWDEKKMPPMYAAKNALLTSFYAGLWGAEAAINKTSEWPWTQKNFPNAPPKVIAFITTIEPEIINAVYALKKELLTETHYPELKSKVAPLPQDAERSAGAKRIRAAISEGINGHRTLSVSELENDPVIQQDILKRLSPLNQWFEERN